MNKLLKIKLTFITATLCFLFAFVGVMYGTIFANAETTSYFEMEQGAYIRIDTENNENGIRFRAKFSDDVKDKIESATEYGFLVFPQQYLVDSEVTDYATELKQYVKIVSDKSSYVENGSNYLNCALVDIREYNRSLEFTAVCYYIDNGTYNYADLDHNFSRSLTSLLSKAYINENAKVADKAANRKLLAQVYDWFPSINYPVQIDSASALSSIAEEVAAGETFNMVEFKLTENVYLGSEFTPIASTFNGTIDVDNKEVTFLYGKEICADNTKVVNNTNIKSIPETTDSATEQWMTENNVTQYGVKTIGADNTFTMYASSMTISGKCPVDHGNPYIAFNGNYGAGTFVSLDFVGKAMPYVSFFNKNVTNSMMDGEDGILLVNGVGGYNTAGVYTTSIDKAYTVMAPKKAESGNYWSGERTTLTSQDPLGDSDSKKFGAANLVDGTNYRLVVGITYCQAGTGANAKFTVNAKLINVDTNTCVSTLVTPCTLNGKITTTIGDDYFSGSIVIYGSTFGETVVKNISVDENGSFGLYGLQNLEVNEVTQTWIDKNSIKYYNAETIASDGTFTLAQNKYILNDGTKNINMYNDAPYLALDQDINFAGTAISFDFSGKNMPFIGLAQSNLTSSWTNEISGLLIANGFYDYNNIGASGRYTNRLQLFKDNLPANGYFWDDGTVMVANGTTNSVGVENLEDGTDYRIVLFIENNASYGWQLYYRLFTLRNGVPHTAVLSGNVKIGNLTDYSDDYFIGKLMFWSAPAYKAQFKINGIYQGVTASNLYPIAAGTYTGTNSFFQLAA